MERVISIKPSKDHMVESLVNASIEHMINSASIADDLAYLFRVGFRGFENMAIVELRSEYQEL